MPVEIPIVQPADLAGAFLTGVHTAGQLRNEQMKIQAQQAETNARLQQAAQTAKEESDVKQQQIRVTAAYNNQKATLRKQQIDAAAAVNADKTRAAARQYGFMQEWNTGMQQIEGNATMTPEQKAAAKNSLTMRLGPMMGRPGTETSAIIRATAPAKPTVPASMEDQGDFIKVTQPNGQISIHQKPKPTAAHDPSVKVVIDDQGTMTTMPKSQALRAIRELSPEIRSHPVNMALLKGAVADMQGGLPATVPPGVGPAAAAPVPATSPAPAAGPKKLDAATARQLLDQAKGDKAAARKLAKDAGYEF